MVTKQELLQKLRDMLIDEEAIIPIYSRHLTSALFLSELSDADRGEVRSRLEVLLRESQQHQKILETMIRDIEGGARDVY